MLKQLVYTIISTLVFVLIITTMFSFFGVGVDVYGNYLLWIIALIFFYTILPTKIKSVFDQ